MYWSSGTDVFGKKVNLCLNLYACVIKYLQVKVAAVNCYRCCVCNSMVKFHRHLVNILAK